MARLHNRTVDELEEVLDRLEGNREVQRLIAALIYKRGPSVPAIADWLDKREATVYKWFDRLESEPIEQAVKDRQRSGRPRKLRGDDRAEFELALENSPEKVGYTTSEWTVSLAQQYLSIAFDVEYSQRHVRRLLQDYRSTE